MANYSWAAGAPNPGSWTTAANWTGGPAGTYPLTSADTATLSRTLSANYSVTLPNSTTISPLTIAFAHTGASNSQWLLGFNSTGSLWSLTANSTLDVQTKKNGQLYDVAIYPNVTSTTYSLTKKGEGATFLGAGTTARIVVQDGPFIVVGGSSFALDVGHPTDLPINTTTLGISGASLIQNSTTNGLITFYRDAKVSWSTSYFPLIAAGGVKIASGTGAPVTRTLTAGTLTSGTQFFEISGGLSGSVDLILTGTQANSIRLTGPSSASDPYTGTLTQSAGAVAVVGVTSTTALRDGIYNTASSPAISFPASSFIGGLTGSTNATFSTAVTLGGVNVDVSSTWNGGFGGTPNVTKSGPVGATGRLTLNGTSTRTGGSTTISRGVIRLTSGTGLYASGSGITSVTANTGALELANNITTPSGPTLTLNGTGLTSGGALRNVSGNNTYGASITLGSAASITTDAGQLTVNAIATAGNAVTFSPAASSTIVLAGSTSGSGSAVVSGSGTVKGGASNFINLTGGTTVSGVLDAGGFNASLGTLAGAGSITTSTGTSTLTIGGTASTTFAGAISGAVGITKTGTGTQTLSGANTPTGATAVSAGTLSVTGSIGAGSAVSVAATLGGTGSVGGAVTVSAGGTISAGLGAGSGNLSLGSTLAYSGTGVIAPSAQALGASLSKVAITGALSLGGNVTVNATAPSWSAGTYEFASYASESGAGSFVAGTLTGGTGRQSISNVVTGATSATFDVVDTNVAVTWAGGIAGDWYPSEATGWTGAGSVTNFLDGDTVTFNATNSTTATLTSSVSVASLTMSGNVNQDIVGPSDGSLFLTNNGSLAVSGTSVTKRFSARVVYPGAISINVGASTTLAANYAGTVGDDVFGGSGDSGTIALGANSVIEAESGSSTYCDITTPTSSNSFISATNDSFFYVYGTISGATTATLGTYVAYVGDGQKYIGASPTYKQGTLVSDVASTPGKNVLGLAAGVNLDSGSRIYLGAGGILELEDSTFTRRYGNTTSPSAYIVSAGGGFSSASPSGLSVTNGGLQLLIASSAVSNTTRWFGRMYFGTAYATALSRTTFTAPIDCSAKELEVHVFEGAVGLGTESSAATLSGVISGTGTSSKVVKYGTGSLSLPATNTYASDTVIYDGIVEASSLADDGVASSIGNSTNGSLPGGLAVLSFGDATTTATSAATLKYIGATTSTNRAVYAYGAAGIDASGTGPVSWTWWISGVKSGANTVTLSGSNTSNNQAQYFYEDPSVSATLNLVKSGAGTWLIDATVAGASPANPKLRTGTNTISAGLLKAKTSSSIGLTTLGSGAVTLAGKLQVWNTTSGASSMQVSSLTTSGGSARLILGA